jgi:xanthine dehydrogenase small subunit
MRDGETVAVGDGAGRRFVSPATPDALAETLLAEPDAVVVAGATDVGLWVTKRLERPGTVVHLGRVAALRRIEDKGDAVELGATVTHAEAAAALGPLYPDLGELWRRFACAQIRNAGTVGGNIANGSPIGDAAPALIAIGAELRLRRGDERRSMPLERFFLAYGKQDRRPGEFVESVLVPKPAAGSRFRAYKVSKRFDQDISAVLGAFSLRVEGGVVRDARFAYGGMAATPKRAEAAEAAAVGRPWDEATAKAAMAALGEDFRPISDARASAAYRMKVARNLVWRCFLETGGAPGAATRLVGRPELARV